jgi:hypothetical protein
MNRRCPLSRTEVAAALLDNNRRRGPNDDKDGNDVVRIDDASESAYLLEFKLID